MADVFAKWRTSGEPLQNNDVFARWRTGNTKGSPEGSYLRMAAQIPRNIASGVMGLGDLASMATNYGLRKAGVNYQFGYPGEEVARGIDTLTGGYTTPQTSGERLAESGTKAIADTLAQAATGAGLAGTAVKGAAKLGRGLAKINPTNPAALAATGAGATAGQAYNEANPSNGNNLENLAGSLGAGLAADIGTRTALGALNPRSMANVLKINPKNVEAFHGMGVSPTLGQASEHPLIKSAENTIKNVGLTSELRNATAKQYKHILETLGPGAKGLAHTEQEAGKNIKSAFEEYGKKASDITEKLKKQYMKKVAKAPTNLIDVTDSLNYFEKLEHELGTETAKSELKNTAIGKQYESLRKKALENRGTVPLNDLEEFRRTLFDEISKGELGTVSKGRLTQLRSKLNDDIKDYMQGIGASKEWNRYNKFYSQWAEKRKPYIVEAREVPNFEANRIFDSIGHSGDLDRSLLDTVYASQKKTTQKETLDALIQKMGKKGNEYDSHLLAKRFSKQPKETQDLLLKPLSSPMKKKFESVIDSIDKMKELAAYGNPSRTAYTQYSIEGTKMLGATGLSALMGHSPTDAFWAYALGSAFTVAISKGMFANPKFINWAYKGTKIKNPKAMEYHIKGLKGILGRPAYQEIIHNLNGGTQDNHYAKGGNVINNAKTKTKTITGTQQRLGQVNPQQPLRALPKPTLTQWRADQARLFPPPAPPPHDYAYYDQLVPHPHGGLMYPRWSHEGMHINPHTPQMGPVSPQRNTTSCPFNVVRNTAQFLDRTQPPLGGGLTRYPPTVVRPGDTESDTEQDIAENYGDEMVPVTTPGAAPGATTERWRDQGWSVRDPANPANRYGYANTLSDLGGDVRDFASKFGLTPADAPDLTPVNFRTYAPAHHPAALTMSMVSPGVKRAGQPDPQHVVSAWVDPVDRDMVNIADTLMPHGVKIPGRPKPTGTYEWDKRPNTQAARLPPLPIQRVSLADIQSSMNPQNPPLQLHAGKYRPLSLTGFT